MKRRGEDVSAIGPAFRRLIVAASFALAAPLAVQAQVLEIGESGAVTVHDRPEVTLSTGASPIARPQRARSARATRVVATSHDVSDAASTAALSPDLIEAVAWRESRMRQGVISRAGAVGEMQLMPGTARALGVDPFDTRQNLAGGATYLGRLMRRYDGDVLRALAAYNAGPGAVDRYGGIPPFKETRDYVAAILDRLGQRSLNPSEK